MFTRKHALAMRASWLGLLGVALLVASVGAGYLDSATVPFDGVSGIVPAAAASFPEATPVATSTATAPAPATTTATPTATPAAAPTAPATATPESSFFGFLPPTDELRALIEQARMLAPLDPGELDSVTEGGPSEPAQAPAPEPEPVDDGTRVYIPYRAQFDGSRHEGGNCGPAALAMILEYYGHPVETHALRESINRMSGDWGRDSGTSWKHLKQAAESYGLAARGLTNEQGHMQQWTMDDLLAETREGRPVIVLVHYRSLPGHETAGWWGDHYVVFLGMTASGDVVYHDPAFRNGEGQYVITSQARFEQAWTSTWIRQNRQAMSVGMP
ncbi:MAG TPA: C39 family peptidase [Thermomicrobiales bacterium]|nr:C39 family peptidase [Thermomicrobiales bacterium]